MSKVPLGNSRTESLWPLGFQSAPESLLKPKPFKMLFLTTSVTEMASHSERFHVGYRVHMTRGDPEGISSQGKPMKASIWCF